MWGSSSVVDKQEEVISLLPFTTGGALIAWMEVGWGRSSPLIFLSALASAAASSPVHLEKTNAAVNHTFSTWCRPKTLLIQLQPWYRTAATIVATVLYHDASHTWFDMWYNTISQLSCTTTHGAAVLPNAKTTIVTHLS